MGISRKRFIKITAIASAGLLPVAGILAYELDEAGVSALFEKKFNEDLEFHLTDNNLLNLHFYFINAKRKGGRLVPQDQDKGRKSFMIVRLPQMHVTEKGLWEDDWIQKDRKYPAAKMSGYSYLAFQLWPDTVVYDKTDPHKEVSRTTHPRKSLHFTLDNLLNWNDNKNLDLITLVEWFAHKGKNEFVYAELPLKKDSDDSCKSFEKKKTLRKEEIRQAFFTDATAPVERMEPASAVYQKYKLIVNRFLDGNLGPAGADSQFVPITFMEAPQSLILVPMVRDEKGDLATDGNSPAKKFWPNRLVNSRPPKQGFRKYEVWYNTLYFKPKGRYITKDPDKTFELILPSFRAVGMILEKDELFACQAQQIDCEKEKSPNFLPGLLDKTELLFLTQYAKENNFTKADFDIQEINGLFFTGLGLITHLKYYNLDNLPDIDNISLIEYEHVITEGRDIFIKVGRLGYNVKTGQRYKHVIEAKRRVALKDIPSEKNFTAPDGAPFKLPGEAASFLELKQYCECIDTEIVYDADIENWDNKFHQVAAPAEGQLILTNVTVKPDHKRNLFRKLTTREKKRIPIRCLHNGIVQPQNVCELEKLQWFWPVIESQTHEGEEAVDIPPKDYLPCEFEGMDWDNNSIQAWTPFMFIRVDCIKAGDLKDAYQEYFKGVYDKDINLIERRKTYFNGQKIAFIPSIKDKTEPQTKVNILETAFIEHYFNVKLPTAFNGSITKTKYVVAPQVLRAKVFIDHIRDLTQQKIASMVEFHEDFINHKLADLNAAGDGYGNAAKLILKNTDAFINNAEEKANNTYSQIGNALQEAKDRLGNLVIPDIIPDSISMEKFGITLPPGIRKSIENGKAILGTSGDALNKIVGLNPREFLRGKLSNVCGLDLTAILDEIIPSDNRAAESNQTPLFEINKIANQVTDTITSSTVFKETMNKVEEVKKEIQDLEKDYKNVKFQLDEARLSYNATISKISEQIPNADELRNALTTEFERLRTQAFELTLDETYFNEVKKAIDKKANDIKDQVFAAAAVIKDLAQQKQEELAAFDSEVRAEINKIKVAISADPLFKPLLDNIDTISSGNFIAAVADEYKTFLVNKSWDEIKKEIITMTDPLIGTIEDNESLKNGNEAVFYNKSSFAFEPKNASETGMQDPFTLLKDDAGFIQTRKKIEDIRFFLQCNVDGSTFQKEAATALGKVLASYQLRLKELVKKVEAYTGAPDGTLYILSLNISKCLAIHEAEFSKVGHRLEAPVKDAINRVIFLLKTVSGYIDLLRKVDPYFYFTEIDRINKKLADTKRRIFGPVLSAYENIIGSVTTEYINTIAPYKKYTDSVMAFYNSSNDNDLLTKLNDARNEYAAAYSKVLTALTEKADKFLSDVVANNGELKNLYGEMNRLREYIEHKEFEYEEKLKKYLSEVERNITSLEGSLLEQLSQFIIDHPDEIEKINEARNLIRLLTTIKKQDLTYQWSTESFRDINLGIVSFRKFSRPNTRLTVD
ncbi:MAG: hypothetical protein J7527_06225, partial [Chitinophagaceae bacterium]|nr:hypothetical protein [Chitinophagaceae bacterium]